MANVGWQGFELLYYGRYAQGSTTYIRQFGPEPVVDVISRWSFYARGIAVCLPEDNFSRKEGRDTAKSKADAIMSLFAECKYDHKLLYSEHPKLRRMEKTMSVLLEGQLDSFEKHHLQLAKEFTEKRAAKVASAPVEAK